MCGTLINILVHSTSATGCVTECSQKRCLEDMKRRLSILELFCVKWLCTIQCKNVHPSGKSKAQSSCPCFSFTFKRKRASVPFSGSYQQGRYFFRLQNTSAKFSFVQISVLKPSINTTLKMMHRIIQPPHDFLHSCLRTQGNYPRDI